MTDKVYEFLTAPGRTAEDIRAKRRIRAEKLSGMVPGAIRYDVPRVQTSPADRMSQAAAEVDALEREIAELRERLRGQRRAVVYAAAKLESPEAAEVLVRRYIDGLRWKDVARAMHKSQSAVFRMHRQAAEELHSVLPDPADLST